VFFLLDSGLLGINLGFSGELWVAGYVYTAFSLVLLILWELEVFDHPLQIILGLALAAGLGYLWGAWPRASGVFLPFFAILPLLMGGRWTKRWRLAATMVFMGTLVLGNIIHDGWAMSLVFALAALPLVFWVGANRTNQFQFQKKTQSRLFHRIEELENRALRDEMTGLLNRKALEKLLQEEDHRNLRYKRGYSIALLDIDQFRSLNGSYGEDVGDELLKGTAELFKHRIRKVDALGRWIGVTFLLLFPETQGSHAKRVLEGLKASFNQKFSQKYRGVSISLSGGVADTSQGKDYKTILLQAQLALHLAKETGGDKVTLSEGIQNQNG
jgi:diguanylate cyclase (GGDEF)-like protein